MNNKSATFCLVAAIVWTVIALFAVYVLFFASSANIIAKICGMFLIGCCLAGQWLRYKKVKKK